MQRSGKTLQPFEFNAGFRAAPEAARDPAPEVSMTAGEFAALLAQARSAGELAAAESAVARAEARVEGLEKRLEAALADLVALARFVDRRAASTALSASASAMCARVCEGQGDLFPTQPTSDEDR